MQVEYMMSRFQPNMVPVFPQDATRYQPHSVQFEKLGKKSALWFWSPESNLRNKENYCLHYVADFDNKLQLASWHDHNMIPHLSLNLHVGVWHDHNMIPHLILNLHFGVWHDHNMIPHLSLNLHFGVWHDQNMIPHLSLTEFTLWCLA